LPHNGVDIDEFILLTFYPIIAFFAIGFLAKKFKLGEALGYLFQGVSCLLFAVFLCFHDPQRRSSGSCHSIDIVWNLVIIYGKKAEDIS
jgi:hypothetical protein